MTSRCETCARMREVLTPRGSRFLLCELSRTDPSFPKYPPQPVMQCSGWRPGDANGTVRWETRPVAGLKADEQSALQTLSRAVYPPETAAAWPGRAIEWATHQGSVIGWGAGGDALCYVGVLVREARWNERVVKVGGIGGVKTHPASRGRGLATTAIQLALDSFRDQGDVDFGLLVCEPALVSFYERLGWRTFPGNLFVTQRHARMPFTFNLPMTIPMRLHALLGGTIDLLGPPW
jgi:aminoglycoside 2'-N-acetyltransferase I